MIPVIPEPPGDIRAQLAAVLDPNHPKHACFLTPADAASVVGLSKVPGIVVVQRAEGTLITTSPMLADLFRNGYSEPTMAQILGYPESKDEVIENSPHPVILTAWAVQARDAAASVVTEAFCSPSMFGPTCEAMLRHVPQGGQMVVLSPIAAITRRVTLRQA